MQYAHDAAGTPTPAAADRRRAPRTHEALGLGAEGEEEPRERVSYYYHYGPEA